MYFYKMYHVCSHSYVSGDFKIVSILLFQLVTAKTSVLITSKLFRGTLFQTSVYIELLN
jgi:hypothetical protein